MTDLKDFHENLERMNAAQSKVNMQNDIDKFAIAFAEWLEIYLVINDNSKPIEELLQIFKGNKEDDSK